MQFIRRRCLEIVLAAVTTHNRIANFVHGAQVEDVVLLLFDWLVAELTDELQPQTGRRFIKLTFAVMLSLGKG